MCPWSRDKGRKRGVTCCADAKFAAEIHGDLFSYSEYKDVQLKKKNSHMFVRSGCGTFCNQRCLHSHLVSKELSPSTAWPVPEVFAGASGCRIAVGSAGMCECGHDMWKDSVRLSLSNVLLFLFLSSLFLICTVKMVIFWGMWKRKAFAVNILFVQC